MFSSIRQHYQIMKDHSNVTKMHFWMIQRAKKRFLAIFWALVCWINLILHNVIVLNVFQHSTTLPDHEGSFKCHKNSFLNDPKPKKRFLAIFWSLVCLILHIVILLNVFQLLATLPGHEGSFKGRKNAFWMIQRARKTFLAIFWSLDCLIGMILHIVIVLDIFQHLATLPCHEGSFENH